VERVKEDPYSTVMFFDLQDYLMEVTTDRGKECLRLAFLAFLGVPIPGIDNYFCSSSPSTPYSPPSERVVDLQLWSLSTNAGWPSNPSSLFPPPTSQGPLHGNQLLELLLAWSIESLLGSALFVIGDMALEGGWTA
jgi:hypothetical protein